MTANSVDVDQSNLPQAERWRRAHWLVVAFSGKGKVVKRGSCYTDRFLELDWDVAIVSRVLRSAFKPTQDPTEHRSTQKRFLIPGNVRATLCFGVLDVAVSA